MGRETALELFLHSHNDYRQLERTISHSNTISGFNLCMDTNYRRLGEDYMAEPTVYHIQKGRLVKMKDQGLSDGVTVILLMLE